MGEQTLINEVIEILQQKLSDETLKSIVLEVNNKKLKEIIDEKEQEIQALKIKVSNLDVADNSETVE